VARSLLCCANQKNAFGGVQGDKARKIVISVMSNKITSEDFSAACIKILEDALEDPANRARLLKAANAFHEWVQNFVGKLKPLLVWPKESSKQSAFDPARIADQFKPFVEGIREFVLRVESAPPSTTYEPLFIRFGDHPLVARMFARMIVTLGPEYADENNRQRRTIAKGIRDLGKKKTRRVPFIAKISATILSMPAAHSLIDAIFAESGHQDLGDEFANLLERSAAADPFACRRLADIAQAVAGDISPPRGRKISVATAMHELALEMLRLSGKPRAYTWNDKQEDYIDCVTEATRREVGNPDFYPQPARRRIRARLQRKAKLPSGF
jgi:hypothetical protein